MQLDELRIEQTKLNHEKVDLENQLEAEQASDASAQGNVKRATMRVPLPHRDSINVMQGSFSYYINVVFPSGILVNSKLLVR